MSTEDTDQPDTSHAKIVVDDPEDFARTRQLRSIFDARDKYVETRRSANRKYENGDMEFSTKNSRIWGYMQDFAMAVEPLAKQHEKGRYIFEEKVYKVDSWAKKKNKVDVKQAYQFCEKNAPEIVDKVNRSRSNSPFGRLTGEETDIMVWAATKKGVNFRGVQSMVKRTPSLLYFSNMERIETSEPPQELSDEVFRDLNAVLDDVGLGFEIQESQQTKIDDDLMREVNEWRKQNL